MDKQDVTVSRFLDSFINHGKNKIPFQAWDKEPLRKLWIHLGKGEDFITTKKVFEAIDELPVKDEVRFLLEDITSDVFFSLEYPLKIPRKARGEDKKNHKEALERFFKESWEAIKETEKIKALIERATDPDHPKSITREELSIIFGGEMRGALDSLREYNNKPKDFLNYDMLIELIPALKEIALTSGGRHGHGEREPFVGRVSSKRKSSGIIPFINADHVFAQR